MDIQSSKQRQDDAVLFLVEELRHTLKRFQDPQILQYFCDDEDEKRSTATAIIRELNFQLLQSRPNLIDHILPSFQI